MLHAPARWAAPAWQARSTAPPAPPLAAGPPTPGAAGPLAGRSGGGGCRRWARAAAGSEGRCVCLCACFVLMCVCAHVCLCVCVCVCACMRQPQGFCMAQSGRVGLAGAAVATRAPGAFEGRTVAIATTHPAATAHAPGASGV